MFGETLANACKTELRNVRPQVLFHHLGKIIPPAAIIRNVVLRERDLKKATDY